MSRIITNQEELSEILKALFNDYIERKRTRQLYKDGITIPKRLLIFYYQLTPERRHLNKEAKEFLRHYVACESILENAHLEFEKQGLKEMYDYLLSDEINNRFDIYTLLDLHRKLFSKAPYPDFGGNIRNGDAHLDGVPVDLTPASYIRYEMKMLDYDLKEILDMQNEVKNNPSFLFSYIDKCIMLKCRLIKVHPFSDGNGRSIRAFINKLFIDVDVPPVYISSNENRTYKKAMQKALGEEDFSSIINFYYFKICDSIIELENNYHSKEKKKSSPKTIMNLVKKIKEQKKQLPEHYSLDEEIASMVKDYLDERDITAQILNVCFFNPLLNPHAFVVASYQDNSINGTSFILIDPLFDDFIQEYNLNQTNINDGMIENLKNNGVIFANQNEIYKYILIFNQTLKKNKLKTKNFPN